MSLRVPALIAFALTGSLGLACGLTVAEEPVSKDAGVEDSGPVANDTGVDSAAPNEDANPANCTDGRRDGTETDVDCGGNCPLRCPLDKACTTSDDCDDIGVCSGQVCVLPGSCRALKKAHLGAINGTYTLDVDGAGPLKASTYLCDMTFDNGGWTLILASNKQVTSLLTIGVVTADKPSALPVEEAKALALDGSQVHLRTANLPDRSITSLADGLAIQNLRVGKSPGIGTETRPTDFWKGPFADDAHIKGSGSAYAYPAMYESWNNFSGLFLSGYGSRWDYGTANEAMEVWVR